MTSIKNRLAVLEDSFEVLKGEQNVRPRLEILEAQFAGLSARLALIERTTKEQSTAAIFPSLAP